MLPVLMMYWGLLGNMFGLQGGLIWDLQPGTVICKKGARHRANTPHTPCPRHSAILGGICTIVAPCSMPCVVPPSGGFAPITFSIETFHRMLSPLLIFLRVQGCDLQSSGNFTDWISPLCLAAIDNTMQSNEDTTQTLSILQLITDMHHSIESRCRVVVESSGVESWYRAAAQR